MRELVHFEWNKIVGKKIVIAGFVLMVFLNVMMYRGWGEPSMVVRDENGNYLYGSEALEYDKEIALRYEGELTNEKVRQILKGFPVDGENENKFILENSTYNWAAELFADVDGSWNGTTVEEIFPSGGGSIRMGYSEGWSKFLFMMMELMMLSGFFLVVAIAPVFSDEYTKGTDALILTTRHGRRKCAGAKIAAAFLFALSLFALMVGVNFLLFLFTFGVEGWEASVQTDTTGMMMGVPYPMNFAQAAILSVLLWAAFYLLLTAMTLLFSAVCRTSFIAVVVSEVAYALPMGISVRPEDGLIAKIVALAPIQASQSLSVFWIDRIHLFGLTIVYAAVAALIMAALAVICQGVSGKVFGRHQVR